MSALPIQRIRQRTAEQIRADDARRMQRQHRSAIEQRHAQFSKPILIVDIRHGVQVDRRHELRRR